MEHYKKLVAGGLVLSFALVSSPAFAAEDDAEPDAVVAIENVAPEVLADLAPVSELRDAQTDKAVDVPAMAASVTLPSKVDEPLLLEDGEYADLAVGLPIESAVVDVASNELPVYSAGHDAELVPAVKDDGSVQITMVIDGPAAPSRFAFEFAEGSNLRLTEDGFVIVSDSSGEYVGAVTPAWATDASGAATNTYFEVSGRTLTQVVEHAGAVYPVVADPYLGKTLISGVSVGSYNGKPRYSVYKTTWGNTVATGYGIGSSENPVLGAQILRSQGWSEAVSKGLSTATTIRQQYDCHTVFAAYKNPWNLERARGTNDWWGVNPQTCNW